MNDNKYTKFYDKEALDQLLMGKRSICALVYTKYVKDFVLKHKLDIVDEPRGKSSSGKRFLVVVAVKKKIFDVLSEKDILKLSPEKYKKSVVYLYSKIKNLSVSKASVLLQKNFITSNYSSPEIDILYGFLCGYKPCDILYYIKTRDMGMKQHPLEKKLMELVNKKTPTLEEQHVMCKKCAQKYLRSLLKT